MSWLDRLKSLTQEPHALVENCQNRQNPGYVSFDCASEAHIPSPQGASDDAAREALEERAAIMEYDGGLSREDAEQHAAVGFREQYAHAREAREPPTSEAGRADEVSAPSARAHAREAAKFDAWGDLRPCTLCRNLLRSGRCRAAWVGLLRAARDYEPSHPMQPRRCIGYHPKADDPDQSSGMERWPELMAWQARQSTEER